MTSIHFRDIHAETPDPTDLADRYREFATAFDAADSADDRRAVLRRWDALRRELDTWDSLVSLRFQQDTRDPARKAALDARDEMSPKLEELDLQFIRRIREAGHGEEVAAGFGSHVLDLWSCRLASYDPVIEAETVAESKASARYTELLASARFDFRGETLNLSQLGKYRQHADRTVRHEAARLRDGWFGANAEAFDQLYDELVALRTRQAQKLGAEDFVGLGYRKLGRTDYGPDDVARYREAVREHVVPLCTTLKARQRERLGLDDLMFWDEGVQHPEGNPRPQGDHDWMLAQARAMFDEMGGGLGEFFRLMADGDLLDLKSRAGKASGGFCTSFPSHRVPFIFANFNGTKGDVEVFTHEVGHAFQNWCSREKEPLDYLWPTLEAAEVHSMSLEFLTWPYMERFFGEDAERFRQTHLTESLLFLPYGVAVDHFQHEVYSRPGASPTERLAIWQEMERTYLPWRRYGDLARYAEGGFWQGQPHVFRAPFYYIDYTLAQACALQFWLMAGRDRDAAMRAYVALCRRGGEAPFQDLVRSAGLTSPFDAGCLEEVVAAARRMLEA